MWHSSRMLVLALTSFLGLSAASAGASLRGGEQQHTLVRRLTSVPSLRLHFTIKRDSMFINGASEFDMLANPVLSGANDVSFNGVATILDAGSGATQKFVHLDGTTYAVLQSSGSETVTCLPATAAAPLLSLVNAINSATPVVNVLSPDESVPCSPNNLYKLVFSGATYALCADKQASGAGFKIVGADLDIEAFYLSEAVSITKPALDDAIAATCEKAVTTTAMTAATQALLTGTATTAANATTRALTEAAEEATVVLAGSSCGCKGAKRPCIFFEGLGSTTEAGLQDTTDYFDDIKNHAPCCSSVKFAKINTADYAWTSSIQQQKVCDLAMSMSATSSKTNKTIADTIIVAHSMGNLLLGGALANGKCKLAPTTSWVALSGPMTGSMGSDYLQNACSGNSNGLVSAVANLIGRCPANMATASLAYQGEAYAPAALNNAYTAAQTAYRTYVSAVMCSNAYDGLFSLDQVVYKLGGSVVKHKSKENDGIVEYKSCAGGFPVSKFSNTYTSPFYVTKLNHADTAFRHGDALFNNAQKPVKWFECLL